MTEKTTEERQLLKLTSALYLLLLVVYLVAAFFPEHRIWGVNIWAYYPAFVPFMLFGIGVFALVAIYFFFYRREPRLESNISSDARYYLFAGILTVIFGLGFYFLRARTHFLGDGYTVLSLLAADNPLVKTRELGEAWVHIWLKSFLGGEGESAALLSFQIISIFSGLLFLIVALFFSRKLFTTTLPRILFLLGTVSGGYMLLFFGYVENYSLFVLTVLLYTLTGIMITRKYINKWSILPLQVLLVVFHIIGAAFLVSTLFLLLFDTSFYRKISHLSRKIKIATFIVLAGGAVAVFVFLYTNNYFFRFAFVPIVENRFTSEGYTLFSLKHIVDYLNLLMLLFPALPLVVVALVSSRRALDVGKNEVSFLFLLLVSVLGTIFILDPKLGMPRDWDLFSFVGIPLVVTSYYFLLKPKTNIKQHLFVMGLSITLSLLVLFPRVVSQVIPDIAIKQCKYYFALDKNRNRTARHLLIEYYLKTGDSLKAELEFEQFQADFPEKQLMDSALVLINTGQAAKAVPLLQYVLDVNSLYADAWLNLGKCYAKLGEKKKAVEYIEIANGLNPYNAIFLNYLGNAYLENGQFKEARTALEKALTYAPQYPDPLFALTMLNAVEGRWEQYYKLFKRLAQKRNVRFSFFQALGDFHMSRKDFPKAAEAYREALRRGLDSSYVQKVIEKYPQLKQWLK